jgi:hypothetical protein
MKEIALALQNRVASDIAEQIRATLNPAEEAALEKSKAVNPETYEAYLKGSGTSEPQMA